MEAKLNEIKRKGGREQSKDGRPARPLSAYNIFCHKERKTFIQTRKDPIYAPTGRKLNFMEHVSAKWKKKLDQERYEREEKGWKLSMWKEAQEQELRNTESSLANNEAFSQVNSSNATLNTGTTAAQQQKVHTTESHWINMEVKRTPLINTPVCSLAVGNREESSFKARYSGNAFPTLPFQRSSAVGSNTYPFRTLAQLSANNETFSQANAHNATLNMATSVQHQNTQGTKTTVCNLATENNMQRLSKKRCKLGHPTNPKMNRHLVEPRANKEPSSFDNVHHITPFQTRPYLEEGMFRFPPRPAETEDPFPDDWQTSSTVGTGTNESAVPNDTNYLTLESEKPQAKPDKEDKVDK